MKLKHKMIAIAGIMVASLGWGLWQGQLIGEAVTTDPQSVLNSAPQGLKVAGNDYFNVPKTIGSGNNNAAKVMSGSQGDGVMISQDGQQNTGGAIWSNEKSFDMYKDQRASMWVYMGSNGTAGDGMAFVLQNSSNTAFSGTGESLGVWGVDPRKAGSTTTDLQNTAIPNSWALEFDTNVDQTLPASNWVVNQTDPNSFDIGQYQDGHFNGIGYSPSSGNDDVTETIKGEHIASNYPAQSNSYYAYQQSGRFYTGSSALLGIPNYNYGNYNYFGLAHRGLIRDSFGDPFISVGAWRHITVNYKAPASGSNTGTMTYSFNDKDAKTGAPKPKNNDTYAKESIDLSKLGVTTDSPNVYWGFTGTTGTNTETSMVVFEQVPGQVNANSTASLTNETTGSEINANGSVKGNDQIKATYTLNYESGETDWKNIKGTLNLPANVNWTTGKITYADKTTTALDPSAISGNKLAVDVKNLNSTNAQAVITLEGRAKNTTANSAAAVSTFVGDNAITSAQTNAFSISPSPFTVSVSPKTIAANANTATTVKGSLSSTDSTVTGSNSTLTATLTDATGTTTKLPASAIHLSTTVNAAGGYDFTIDVPKVPAGKSTVAVNATTTASGSYSAGDTATLSGGTIVFGDTSGAITFKTTTLTGNGTQTVPRDETSGAWSLNVDSSLISGSDWKVTAKTAGMYNTDVPDSKLDGNLIYKTGTSTTTLNADDGTLISSKTSDGTAAQTNIASGWTSNSGILLNANGGAVKGNYSGTIDWTLAVAP
ncbi:L-type lectin family protein [Levilactobacillus enshiensis]|uniref:hypothetical protein n=1 Tax=Levilactobacillus enshiensis TaxID=2590213 RepID=UPI00117AA227|nr:hypothetical protein [Levilactobacillus enshiensis]